MSLLNNLKRYLYGTPGMTSIDTGDVAATGQGSQGLIGTGGESGGGLLQQNFNQMNNQKGGLLSNIPEGALLGAALYGEGLKGKDPLAGAFPAFIQSAQVKKLLTPKAKKPFAVTNKETGEPELITLQEYNANPDKYIPDESTTASMKNFKELEKIMETGTPQQKQIAKMVYGKGGREPMSKTEFLSKMAISLGKDVAADPDDINSKLKEFEEIYDNIFSISGAGGKIPEGFKGTLEQWNELKLSNENVSDKDLIKYFNKKYGG
jgi:hypothetical protein